MGSDPKPKPKKGQVVPNKHGQEATMLADDEGKSFPSEKEHVDYYRAKALQDPSIKAKYDDAQSFNQSGDAVLALHGHLPEYKSQKARVKSKSYPEPKYAYQSDRESAGDDTRKKLNKRIQGALAGAEN